MHRALPCLVDTLQAKFPQRLLPTSFIAVEAASALKVTGGAVRKHLTEAVADGMILEILVRRDWLLVPPFVQVPIALYAVPAEGSVFRMVKERPASRGSNGISFLTSLDGYDLLLDEMVNLT